MRSSSVLILGILFTILLITFCVTRFLNQNNPNIKKVSAPTTIYKNQISYKEIIQNIKNEEKKIQNFYEQSKDNNKKINMKTTTKELKQCHKLYIKSYYVC